MLSLCHLECKKWPLSAYISHLIIDHKLPIYEKEEAQMFLAVTPQKFFSESDRPIKLQGLGLLKAFSSNFLVLGLETGNKYWLYAVHLDKPVKDDKKKVQFYCSFEVKSAPTVLPEEDDDQEQPGFYQDLYTSRPNAFVKEKEKMSRVNHNLKLQSFRRMAELCEPIDFGMDKVLSVEESFSTGFDMGRVFQLEKAVGKLFLVGREKISVKVKIHKIDPANNADVISGIPPEMSMNMRDNVFDPSTFEYPYESYLEVDLVEQRMKQAEDDEDDYVEKTGEGDDENEVDDKDELVTQKMSEKTRANFNAELIKIHQAMVQEIREKEQLSPEEVLRHLNYAQNFRDCANIAQHQNIAMFRQGYFS